MAREGRREKRIGEGSQDQKWGQQQEAERGGESSALRPEGTANWLELAKHREKEAGQHKAMSTQHSGSCEEATG